MKSKNHLIYIQFYTEYCYLSNEGSWIRRIFRVNTHTVISSSIHASDQLETSYTNCARNFTTIRSKSFHPHTLFSRKPAATILTHYLGKHTVQQAGTSHSTLGGGAQSTHKSSSEAASRRAHTDAGMLPEKSLPSNNNSSRAARLPAGTSGIGPEKLLSERYTSINLGQFANVDGRGPSRLLPCRYKTSRFSQDTKMEDGI